MSEYRYRLFVPYFQEQNTRDLWLAIQAVRQKNLQLEEKVWGEDC